MSSSDAPKINPAWNEILSKIPEALHPVITPVLQKWDAGVTTKFQELHSQYEPLKAYKNLADHGIDPQYAEQAIMLADRMQSNPKQIAEQLNSSFNLGFVTPEEAAKLGNGNSPSGDPDDAFFNSDDITKHPQFKALADQIKSFQEQFEQTTQQQQEQQQVAQFEEYLDGLEEETKGKDLPFNRRYVTALMTQGLSGEDAVKQYHQDLAIQAVNDPNANETPSGEETPPVIMGGEGSTGGGTPDGSIRFGDLPKNDLNKTVADLLEAQLNSGQ